MEIIDIETGSDGELKIKIRIPNTQTSFYLFGDGLKKLTLRSRLDSQL